MKSGTYDRQPPLCTRLKYFIYRRFRFVCSLWFANGCSQSCFIFGLVSIAGWGICVAIPTLYSEEGNTGPFVRVFGCFLAFQLIVNWLCIKTVDSTYKPYKHGTKPDNVKVGEILNRVQSYGRAVNGTGLIEDESIRQGPDFNTAGVPSTSLNGQPTRTVYSYFSWTPCLRCNRISPPRCHHCPSCNKCILKRDHHCFVTGVCVGFNNLRHFAVFITWSSVATIFAVVHALPYYYYEVFEHTSVCDLFFPIAILRCLLGYIECKYAFLCVVLWVLFGFLTWSTSFFGHVYSIVRTGLTTFEKDNNYMMYDVRPLHERLEAVFGQFWFLNFIVPLHFVFKPNDDPVNWRYVRA